MLVIVLQVTGGPGTGMAFRYHGGYVGCEREGKGRYLYPGGSFSYDGDWVAGVKHGQGELRITDGSVYVGQFVNGEMQGQGERVWPDGSRYRGDVYSGERTGRGSFYDAKTMEMYDGDWCNNVRAGEGTLVWADGSRYTGSFKDNRKTGEGKLTTAAGLEYTGGFEADLYHGSGSLHLPSGSIYVGTFFHGKMHGSGRYDCAVTGMSYEGEWSDDLPVLRPKSLVVESPGLVKLAADLLAASLAPAAGVAGTTVRAKAPPKKDDKKKKGQDAAGLSSLPQLQGGAVLPRLLLTVVLDQPSPSASDEPVTAAAAAPVPPPSLTVAACESGRRLGLKLVRVEADGTHSGPLPWFRRLPTLERVSEDASRFPTTGLRVRYMRDEDVVTKAQPETKDVGARFCLPQGAELGDRGGNPCVVLSGLTSGLHVPMSASAIDCGVGLAVTLDFCVDSSAMLERAVAGPAADDRAEPSVNLLGISTALAVVLSVRVQQPTEDGQRVTASLGLRITDTDNGGAQVVEVVGDVPLDAWHAMVLSVVDSIVTICLDGASFEVGLPACPLPTSGLDELLVGGECFGGGVKNVGIYADPPLELAPALEASVCYHRLREQQWQVTEQQARKQQEWEAAGSAGEPPESMAEAAAITLVEVLTTVGQASAEDLVLPTQLVEGQYAICVEDMFAASGVGGEHSRVFSVLPPASLNFVIPPKGG